MRTTHEEDKEEEKKEEPPQVMISLLREKRKSITATIHHDNRSTGGAVMSLPTVLRDDEIADLKRFHDNSLAANTRKAYLSDYDSFVQFVEKRFPNIAEVQLQTQCTLEHVLAYLTQLCNDGKKIATINRRLSTIKKHILPSLFHKASVPGSRDEQIGRELDAIVRGMRRTVGAEQRVRGKRPLLIENIIAMCEVAAVKTNDDGDAMPNMRCRDVSLLLFLFFSAMRRSEVEQLLWSDLTFDTRGVVVRIRHSKTDKESKGQIIAISRLEDGAASGKRADFCPVKALEAWREKSQGAGDSPVFRWISNKDELLWRVLIDQRIVAIIKQYAGKIGLDSRCFAAHSTRSGYVTSSSDCGVPISEVMKRTRHKSLSSVSVYMKSDDLFNNSGDRRL
jgi:integrase